MRIQIANLISAAGKLSSSIEYKESYCGHSGLQFSLIMQDLRS